MPKDSTACVAGWNSNPGPCEKHSELLGLSLPLRQAQARGWGDGTEDHCGLVGMRSVMNAS